jgi:hypothetical protein
VGVTYFSSARARRIGSARPKSLKEFNSKSFYVRPARLAPMRADAERGVRDIPRGQGCQFSGMSENGAENLRRQTLRRDRLSRGPENSLENQAFVPTGWYMAGCRGVFKAELAKAPHSSRFDLNRGCKSERSGPLGHPAVAKSLIGR